MAVLDSITATTTTTTTTTAFWWVAASAVAGLLVWYHRLDRLALGLVSLLDLLFSVKQRARRVQTKTPEWTMADTFEESCSKHWDNCFVVVAGHDDGDDDDDAKKKKKKTKTQPFQADSRQLPLSSVPSSGKPRMTYGEAEMASSAVAKWMRSPTVRCEQGDIVAIFMPGSCEFVVALFGLIRCGVQAALVNTGLRGNSLVHALTSALSEETGYNNQSYNNNDNDRAAVRAVLVSPDLAPVLESLKETGLLPQSIAIIECGPGCRLDPWIETTRFAYVGRKQGQKKKSSRWDDTCVYIYTSGTTGFPKASKMNHMRLWSAGCVGRKVCRLRSSDRLYCPLPLYHSSGLTLGLGACLQRGCTTVVRPKFSVRHFSRDVLAHKCTGVQYIGEMARYLVSAPANPLDNKINLRFAWGNGMPREVWTAFRQRYKIGLINEFYASTEGNVNIFNNTGLAPGACGIIPPGFDWIYPIGVFRYDTDTEELVRDERTGLCIPAGPNEPGELLGLIKQNDPSRRFDGYTDGDATRSKVVNNVCKTGDSYFRSGDLLKQDRRGFLYFCDRVGETFRWKGENVSTSEVARALLDCGASDGDGTVPPNGPVGVNPGACFLEAVVYGVELEGHPGRAGMATAVLRRNGDYSSGDPGKSGNQGQWQKPLWDSLQSDLPRYAQPLFLRITEEIEKTQTQKYKKKKLQDESFLDCGTDLLYFRDDAAKSFVLIDERIKDEILSGKRRV